MPAAWCMDTIIKELTTQPNKNDMPDDINIITQNYKQLLPVNILLK